MEKMANARIQFSITRPHSWTAQPVSHCLNEEFSSVHRLNSSGLPSHQWTLLLSAVGAFEYFLQKVIVDLELLLDLIQKHVGVDFLFVQVHCFRMFSFFAHDARRGPSLCFIFGHGRHLSVGQLFEVDIDKVGDSIFHGNTQDLVIGGHHEGFRDLALDVLTGCPLL